MTEKKICNLSYTSGNNLKSIKPALVNIEGKKEWYQNFDTLIKNLICMKFFTIEIFL